MSIILSGLIPVFQPLLAQLSGALDCEELSPWYFLVGLRIVAIFFSNGPWDTIQEDVACNWVHPIHDWSRDFCTAMCYNQHFPISVSATWGLVFIVLLLLVGLMKLSSHPKKKDDHKDDSDKDKHKLAVVAVAPHRHSADISTIYMVGPNGLTRDFGRRSSRSSRYRSPDFPYRASRTDRYGPPEAYLPGEPYPRVEYGPSEAERYGGYGMPVYSSPIGETRVSPPIAYGPGEPYPAVEYGPSEVGGYSHGMPVGETRMPDQSYNVPQRKMRVYTMDSNQTKSNMNCPGYNIAVPPWEDDKANVAIKRRPFTRGSKMPTNRCVTFDGTGSSEMGSGSNVNSQPWLAGSSPMPGNSACAETNPWGMDKNCGPQCEPCGGGETAPTSDNNTCPGESIPGPQDKAMTIRTICGIPLFDIWVGLILGTEIGFLLAIVLLQMPRLIGRTWSCDSTATSCPPSVQCALKGRAEKRVALWGLAFTSILFLISCSGYFNLRMCRNKRCRRTCSKKEEGEEACTTAMEPERQGFRGDVEGGNEETGCGE